MRLPDPRGSYAVLIGTSTYLSTELTDLPAVRNNLRDLAAVLTDPALGAIPAERCFVLPDPADPRTVYRALRQYATAAEDTVLVYFAGHGRTGPRNELYLGLSDTDPDELKVSGLAFELIRDVLADSPAANRVVILDCCFSGRAIQDMSGDDETILGQIGIEGTYVLASAPANAVALAPIGATHTAFTGELLNLLRAGVPGGPEFLSFSTIYRRLLHTTTARGLPTPRQRGTGTVDLLALTRNSAVTLGSIGEAADRQPPGDAPSSALAGPFMPPDGRHVSVGRHRAVVVEQPQVPFGTAHAQPGRDRAPGGSQTSLLSPTAPHPSLPPDTLRSESKLPGVAGRLALLAGLTYGLIQALVVVLGLVLIQLHMMSEPRTYPLTFYMPATPLITAIVGIVAWWCMRARDRRVWIGAGLLLSYTLQDALSIPHDLSDPASVHNRHKIIIEYLLGGTGPVLAVPWIVTIGRILLIIAGILAIVVLVRIRPQLGRPTQPRLAISIAVCALASGASYLSFVYFLPGPPMALAGSIHFLWICTALLAVALPVYGVLVRPAPLAVGFITGWLAVATSLMISSVSIWDLISNDNRIVRALFAVANVALIISSRIYFRDRSRASAKIMR